MSEKNKDYKSLLQSITPTPTLSVDMTPEKQIELIAIKFKEIMEVGVPSDALQLGNF